MIKQLTITTKEQEQVYITIDCATMHILASNIIDYSKTRIYASNFASITIRPQKQGYTFNLVKLANFTQEQVNMFYNVNNVRLDYNKRQDTKSKQEQGTSTRTRTSKKQKQITTSLPLEQVLYNLQKSYKQAQEQVKKYALMINKINVKIAIDNKQKAKAKKLVYNYIVNNFDIEQAILNNYNTIVKYIKDNTQARVIASEQAQEQAKEYIVSIFNNIALFNDTLAKAREHINTIKAQAQAIAQAQAKE